MPRRKVVFTQGHYYHIYNRGVDRRSIFREDENYKFVLQRLKKYAAEFGIAMIAYCLMPNHYHFLVRQDGEIPARELIQRVFNSYSKAFNRRFGRSGTLFEGRFKAIHVDKEEYLLHLCRYIHANPVKDGFVVLPEEWQFSNYLEWIGERDGTLVDREFVAEYYPDPAVYAAEVRDYLLGKKDLPMDIRVVLEELES